MGTLFNKPRLPPHIRDSIVLCDGLSPLVSPSYVVTADGRFVFILGNERISSVDSGTTSVLDAYEDENAALAVTFDLDVVDLLLSKRTRVNIGDLYGAGFPAGMYALDKRTVVLVDLPEPRMLCQRVVQIDWSKAEAECTFFRTYKLTDYLEAYGATTLVDKGLAVTVAEAEGEATHAGFVYAANPLSSRPLLDITAHLEEASEHLADAYSEEAVICRMPFFFSDHKLGFPIEKPEETFDPTHFIEIDTMSGSIELRQLPHALFTPPPMARYVSHVWSAGDGGHEMNLAVWYKCTDESWQSRVAAIIFSIMNFGWRLGYRIPAWIPQKLTDCLDAAIECLNEVRYSLLRPFSGCGILDVRTMKWTTIPLECADTGSKLLRLADGELYVISKTEQVGGSRQVGDKSCEEMEGFELVAHPKRVQSLVRLSTIAVQRSGRVIGEYLEMIGERIG